MAQVYPFPAYRYNPSRVSFDRVLTQPYDKISLAAQEKYYAADPHNLIVVEKGRVLPDDAPGHNVYTRAAEALESWIRDNVVAQRWRAFVLRVHAGVHRAGHGATGDAARFHWCREIGGIFGGGGVPSRAHAFGAEGGPAGVAAAHSYAHRSAVYAVPR